MIDQAKKADANPTKAFFVRMITRDISLEDCVLDLIDNSVDAAWGQLGGPQITLAEGGELAPYLIEIEIKPERFCIRDNCGGISFDDAANYAFTFGRKEGMQSEKYSIGVYGIGMKRAVFKIGSEIKLVSTHSRPDGKVDAYAVPIDVAAWLAKEDRSWDFDIEPAEPLPKSGLDICVSKLTEDTQSSFSSPLFIETLKRTIGRDYAIHLRRGLTIKVNGQVIDGWLITLLQSGDLSPMRIEYVADGDSNVGVQILAGMAGLPPESSEPDESDKRESRYGWYVICNGRVVVAADRTVLTGWGTDDWPQWHPQYAGFIGLILFTAENAALLPLTTTKRSIDASASIYRRAKPRMREVTKQWISYTNTRKQAIDQAKKMEASAKPVSIFAVRQQEQVALPVLTAKPRERTATIQYSMPLARVKTLADGMGNINMSYREVGIQSFEYTYRDKVGEE